MCAKRRWSKQVTTMENQSDSYNPQGPEMNFRGSFQETAQSYPPSEWEGSQSSAPESVEPQPLTHAQAEQLDLDVTVAISSETITLFKEIGEIDEEIAALTRQRTEHESSLAELRKADERKASIMIERSSLVQQISEQLRELESAKIFTKEAKHNITNTTTLSSQANERRAELAQRYRELIKSSEQHDQNFEQVSANAQPPENDEDITRFYVDYDSSGEISMQTKRILSDTKRDLTLANERYTQSCEDIKSAKDAYQSWLDEEERIKGVIRDKKASIAALDQQMEELLQEVMRLSSSHVTEEEDNGNQPDYQGQPGAESYGTSEPVYGHEAYTSRPTEEGGAGFDNNLGVIIALDDDKTRRGFMGFRRKK